MLLGRDRTCGEARFLKVSGFATGLIAVGPIQTPALCLEGGAKRCRLSVGQRNPTPWLRSLQLMEQGSSALGLTSLSSNTFITAFVR